MDAILNFVKNRGGGNNLVDDNGFEYRIRRVVAEKDRSYWMCVSKKKDNCPATAITVTSEKILVRHM